jgi:predicted nucleotidyltransferase
MIHGIMLMGSVAQGTVSEKSDLDIMILGDTDKFIVETIDGILVEYIYCTVYTAKQRLMSDDMDMYHYLDNKIVYDKHAISHILCYLRLNDIMAM